MEHREIVNFYKHAIQAGDYAPGERLPSARQIVEEHGTSHTTAGRALRALQMEGWAVAKGTTGTFAAVPGGGVVLRMPIIGARQAGVHTPGGRVDVLAAALVRAPEAVVAALGLCDGELAIRRESTITRDGQVLRLSVNWMPGGFSVAVPELLTLEHVWAGDLVRERMGRGGSVEIDRFYARTADKHEAEVLGILVGTALQVREMRWHDEEGMIEYAEAVYPPGVSIQAEYLKGDA